MTNTSPTTRKGRLAEALAARVLEEQGYIIEFTNFRCRFGEIDIIASHGEEIVFIEVRSGTLRAKIDPIYSIDRHKQRKIARTAEYWFREHELDLRPARFDVVIVRRGNPPVIEITPNAFNLNDLV